MTQPAIITQDSGWMGKINSNFSGLVTDTNWQSAGITMLNGWQADGSDPIQYRIITIGNLTLVEIGGWVSGPAMLKNAGTDICSLPDSVVKYFSDSYNTKVTIGQGTVRTVNGNATVSNGKLHFVIYNDYTLNAGDGFWIGLLSIVAAKQ